jgi:small GTP-binding protein
MPTNLPAEAKKKLAEYQAARTIEEKIKVLSEALSLIPDHKGTEKLRRQIRKRLAELRREEEERRRRRVGSTSVFSVKKEGWAQISLIGAANSGKSSILNILTGASSPVADYPLTTQKPYLGMMIYENVEIQIVDLPSILTHDLEETSYASKSIGVARNSDLIAIVVDLTNKPLDQLRAVIELLKNHGISVEKKRCEVIVEKKDSGGLRIITMGKTDFSYNELRQLLLDLGLRSAVIKIVGDATLDEVQEQILTETAYKKAVVIFNKADQIPESQLESIIKHATNYGLKFIYASCNSEQAKDSLKKFLFESLEMIRVYTQKDGQPSPKPLLLPRGTTVQELAEIIHRDLAKNMKYARVWGRSVKIQGQRVGPEFVLEDGDLIEIKD